MLVDRIEWAENKTLPTEVDVEVSTKANHYIEIAQYLKERYNDTPIAFRYRANGLINGYRDWSKGEKR